MRRFYPSLKGWPRRDSPAASEIKGEYRLVTIFNRTGQVSTNDTVPFDSPTLAATQNRAYNTSLPYTGAQQGISGGP